MPIGHRASFVVSTDALRLRSCLAPGHRHEILTTADARLCARGRAEVARLDPRYAASSAGGRRRPFATRTGLATYASAGEEE